MIRRLTSLFLLIFFALVSLTGDAYGRVPGAAQGRRMVIIDQDRARPGGTDQMAMMILLQSPQTDVLGLTMVTGDAWEPEEVQHTLRMLELIHRTDVPVVPGAGAAVDPTALSTFRVSFAAVPAVPAEVAAEPPPEPT